MHPISMLLAPAPIPPTIDMENSGGRQAAAAAAASGGGGGIGEGDRSRHGPRPLPSTARRMGSVVEVVLKCPARYRERHPHPSPTQSSSSASLLLIRRSPFSFSIRTPRLQPYCNNSAAEMDHQPKETLKNESPLAPSARENKNKIKMEIVTAAGSVAMVLYTGRSLLALMD